MTLQNPLSQTRFLVTAMLLIVGALACVEVTRAQSGESQAKESA